MADGWGSPANSELNAAARLTMHGYNDGTQPYVKTHPPTAATQGTDDIHTRPLTVDSKRSKGHWRPQRGSWCARVYIIPNQNVSYGLGVSRACARYRVYTSGDYNGSGAQTRNRERAADTARGAGHVTTMCEAQVSTREAQGRTPNRARIFEQDELSEV